MNPDINIAVTALAIATPFLLACITILTVIIRDHILTKRAIRRDQLQKLNEEMEQEIGSAREMVEAIDEQEWNGGKGLILRSRLDDMSVEVVPHGTPPRRPPPRTIPG